MPFVFLGRGQVVIELLREQPLLLLFLVAAVGYPLGRITVRGTSLGIAAVLFVGIAFGALDPKLKIPEVLYQFGLALFIYTLGLSNSAVFFRSLRQRGLRDNGLVFGVISISFLLAFGLAKWFHLNPRLAAGMFSGGLTNTPALAGVLEAVKHSAPPEKLSQLMAEPVVGYSIAYPGGVLGMILAMLLLRWFWRVDFRREAESIRDAVPEPLENRTIRIKSPEASQFSVERLTEELELTVAFSRHRRGDTLSVVTPETQLQAGDLVSVVGPPEAVAAAVAALGEETGVRLEFDRSELDFRRIFVSNPKLAGQTIESLELDERFGAVATRIRRGDIDLAALPDTEIEIGDRVRIVAPPAQMDALGRFFGDSYRAASELDILTFSLGLALGLALGLIPIPVAPGIHFKLGLAGGPLIVALILGKLDRTGPFAWNPPFGTNVTLRQIGLVIFLAGVGTQAGYAFVSTLFARGGALIFALGLSVTLTAAFSALVVGYKLLRMPLGLLYGVLAGMQTQPAVLGFAVEQTKNDLPNVGYASVFPFATILKIILAQVLFVLLQ